MPRYRRYSYRPLVKTYRNGRYEANDEGFYWDWCPVERKNTEHERGECLSCWNNKKH